MTRGRTVMQGAAYALAAAAIGALISAPAAAQIAVGSKVGEPAPSSGSYDSLGRRDPFVSLITPRRTTSNVTPRMGTGLGSFAVADVTVTGIVSIGVKSDTRVAILQNVDKQSYIAKVGARLADGTVKSIDDAGVVLIEFGEPGISRPREIRKLLHPIDEVKR
jgi:hypothetical protein